MTVWNTPAEAGRKLRMTADEVRGLCKSRQIAWRPRNPDAIVSHYLISDEAIAAYEKAITRPVQVRPIRRLQSVA